MLDVFKEEHDLLIKNGMANIVWKRDDLIDLWEKACVPSDLCQQIRKRIRLNKFGSLDYLSKYMMMNELYANLKNLPLDRRLRISREFVKILVTWEDFIPKSEKHNIVEAERIALKLRDIIRKQNEKRESKNSSKIERKKVYEIERRTLYDEFLDSFRLDPQNRGRKLELIFNKLLNISSMKAIQPFRIVGEQIDGVFAFPNSDLYYIVEIKWTKKPSNIDEVSKLLYKIEGKLQPNRGLLISMEGFSNEILQSMYTGRNLKLILLDGVHITNVLSGTYLFNQLIDYAIERAATFGEIFPSYNINS